jgi:hypothetical protein
MTFRDHLLGATCAVACFAASDASAQVPQSAPASAAAPMAADALPLKVTSVEFTATPAPATLEEMAAPYTRSEAIVTLADGAKKTFPLS